MEITKIYKPDEVAQAAKEIQLGELIAFPTETVYGLGADATNEKAVRRVFQAKGRPADNPLNVTVCSTAMVERFVGKINEWGQKLIKQFWPGPLTLIFKTLPHALAPVVTGGLPTAAFRMPDNQVTLKMIELAGTPIVGPSANSSGKPSPTTAEHVFHDMEGKIAGIVDDGPTAVGVESTIIDLSGDTPIIIRPGAISTKEIENVLGMKVLLKDSKDAAPAAKYKHYNPDAQVLMVNDQDWDQVDQWLKNQDQKVAVMATDKVLASLSNAELQFSLGQDVQSASKEFFAGIRHLDNDEHAKMILVQKFPTTGLGEAYMNRLEKASGNQTWGLE